MTDIDTTENTETTPNLSVRNRTSGEGIDMGSLKGLDAGKIVGGFVGMLSPAISQYNSIGRAEDYVGQLNAYRLDGNTGYGLSEAKDALLNYSPVKYASIKDFGYNQGKADLNVLSGTASGASMFGSSPLAGAGAALGFGINVLGNIMSQRKAAAETTAYNREVAKLNRYNYATLDSNLKNAKADNIYNSMYYSSAQGGPLSTQGSDWNTGLNYIGNGGSHEQNPNDGVQMGIAPDGLPNLVEEGEVIWNNDYVFSKRLKVNKSDKEKLKLGYKDKPLSFADAALKLNKEMDEMPNDPIAKRTSDAMLSRLADAQEEKRAKIQAKEQAQQAAMMDMMGMPQDQMVMQEPMVPEEQPIDEMGQGMPMAEGYAAKGGPIGYKYDDGSELYRSFRPEDNYVYKGELDYLNRPFIGDALPLYDDKLYPVPSYDNTDERNKLIAKQSALQPSLKPVSPLSSLPTSVTLPSPGEIKVNLPKGRWGNINSILKLLSNGTYPKDKNNYYDPVSKLRYAPAVGSGLALLGDLFGITNRPDYSAADAIARAAGSIRDVSFKPLGNYARYTPVDRMIALNQLNANAAATRRAIANTSGGNRGTALAGILAADNNYMNNIGNMLFSAENANYDRYMKALAHNTDIDKTNSSGFLQAATSNQRADEARARYASLAADARLKAKQTSDMAKSNNWNNFFDNLGNIGIDAANRMDTRWLASYWPGASKAPNLQGVKFEQGPDGYYYAVGYAKGGKLNKKNRRRYII